MSSRVVREWRWVLLAVMTMVVVVVALSLVTSQRCDCVRWTPSGLVITVLALPTLLLVAGRPRAAFASAAPQVLVGSWFVTVSCGGEGRGCYDGGFVGGLGVVHLLGLSVLAAIVLGGIGFAFDGRGRRRARVVAPTSG